MSRPFRFEFPVRFSEVDHAGIVYYPNFFHYFHIAFEEMWRERLTAGGYVGLLDRDRVGLPAVHTEASFRKPFRFGQSVSVEVTLARLGHKSVSLRYRAFDAADPEGEPHAEATITCATIDLDTFRAIPVPARLREVFEQLAPAP